MSAILLHIAGVSRETILEDFLLSNEYSINSITASFNKIAHEKGVQAAIALSPFMGVQKNWLELALNEAESNFGSMDEYITEGLGLSKETQEKLKRKIVN